ncbi:hypothetical protein [Nocardioides sp. Kera G14]|uniref:hypothetical protein n=1 Tax=Nocardioides sp. Kera G14 TaxID=2884264 RepID=UPI001D125148|nr:hypothetical protein [Nocardioides sp. Kera G14]UDY24322.1 hypothetical protein LH076_03200 [Nocardioides sp. Kera G14]
MSTTTGEPTALHVSPGDDDLIAARLVSRRRPGQWISAAVVLLLVGGALWSVVTNPRFQWDVVGHFLLRPSILDGLWLTLWLTAATVVVGYILGVGLAAMRLSGTRSWPP